MSAPTKARSQLGYVAPFFIVRDVKSSLAFYRDHLGFEVAYLGPDNSYYAIVKRDSFREPLGINSDNLRGFEIMDADGYVLYFGRPV